jgi:regulator of protease activity HflC (stomatin/prohibitin superfamily)
MTLLRRLGAGGTMVVTNWSGTFVFIIILLLLVSSVRIFWEYERGVVFTLGRYSKVKGPGLVFIVPLLQQVVRVDLRTIVLEVPTQDVISRDNHESLNGSRRPRAPRPRAHPCRSTPICRP